MTELARAGLQSDQRYTESYINQRISRGYGPLRIRRELAERGVATDLIEQALEALDVDWFEAMVSDETAERPAAKRAAGPALHADPARLERPG